MTNGGVNGSTWKWTRQKEDAALLLSEGKTWAVLEKEHGIPHSTLAKWMKAPEFRQRIDEHHEEVIGEVRRILRRNASFAAQRMVDMAFNGNQAHGTRLAAAKDILDRVGLKPPEEQRIGGRIEIEYINDWRHQE